MTTNTKAITAEELAQQIYTKFIAGHGADGWQTFIMAAIREALAQSAKTKEVNCAYALDHDGSKVFPQSASVPVLGEAVALLAIGIAVGGGEGTWHYAKAKKRQVLHGLGFTDNEIRPLYLAPTDHVTREELKALRKDAGRYRWLQHQVDDVIGSDIDLCTHEDNGGRYGYWKPINFQLSYFIDRSMQEWK